MGINNYRDEAGAFLYAINAEKEPIESRLRFLEEEYQLLIRCKNDPEKLQHQIYDMFFILMEIAHDYQLDIDMEWDLGREKKKILSRKTLIKS